MGGVWGRLRSLGKVQGGRRGSSNSWERTWKPEIPKEGVRGGLLCAMRECKPCTLYFIKEMFGRTLLQWLPWRLRW